MTRADGLAGRVVGGEQGEVLPSGAGSDLGAEAGLDLLAIGAHALLFESDGGEEAAIGESRAKPGDVAGRAERDAQGEFALAIEGQGLELGSGRHGSGQDQQRFEMGHPGLTEMAEEPVLALGEEEAIFERLQGGEAGGEAGLEHPGFQIRQGEQRQQEASGGQRPTAGSGARQRRGKLERMNLDAKEVGGAVGFGGQERERR